MIGKTLIVTGGSSGIGRATAVLCAKQGARVVIGDINETGASDTVSLIESFGGRGEFIETDIANEEDVSNLVQITVSKYGRLDGAFNNSGIPNVGKKLADISRDAWHRVLNINLTGTFFCIKHEIKSMLGTGGGAIVNNSSVAGLVAIPKGADYIASKHGIIGLTRAAAADYGKDAIRVNAIAPAACLTESFQKSMSDSPERERYLMGLHPIGRFSHPPEVAEVVMWLLSDASAFVHGACIPVDGGYTAI